MSEMTITSMDLARKVRLFDGTVKTLVDIYEPSPFPYLCVDDNKNAKWHRVRDCGDCYPNGYEDIVAFVDEGEKEAPPKKKRKIIQISGDSIPGHGDSGEYFNVYALCDDGTVWEYGGSKSNWTKLPDIPQDDAEGEKK